MVFWGVVFKGLFSVLSRKLFLVDLLKKCVMLFNVDRTVAKVFVLEVSTKSNISIRADKDDKGDEMSGSVLRDGLGSPI